VEAEICTKMLKKLSEKLPSTTLGYSMVRIARIDDAFSEYFKLEAGPVDGQPLQQRQNKTSKRKGEERK